MFDEQEQGDQEQHGDTGGDQVGGDKNVETPPAEPAEDGGDGDSGQQDEDGSGEEQSSEE